MKKKIYKCIFSKCHYNINDSLIKIFLIFGNITIILINIYLFFLNNNKSINLSKETKSINLDQIRNSDLFPLTLSNKNFFEISNYLNSKYNKNQLSIFFNQTFKSKIKIITSHKKKKKIVLYGVDLFSVNLLKNWLKNILKNKFIIKYSSNHPDYLIYNVFGSEHLEKKYKDSIKIAFFTENVMPNINEVDYAISHFHINYLDKFFRINLIIWNNLNNLDISRNELLNSPKRTKFCAALISNNHTTDRFRLKFINELNKYKKIHSGGHVYNNIGRTIGNKLDFLKEYKFSISMENSNGDGYISEKIIDSFKAGTIPIYYGDYMLDEYINPKTYILIKGEKDMYKKIEYIKEIDNNDELYKNILREKVLLDENLSIEGQKELKEFLSHIFEQDKLRAHRIDQIFI